MTTGEGVAALVVVEQGVTAFTLSKFAGHSKGVPVPTFSAKALVEGNRGKRKKKNKFQRI